MFLNCLLKQRGIQNEVESRLLWKAEIATLDPFCVWREGYCLAPMDYRNAPTVSRVPTIISSFFALLSCLRQLLTASHFFFLAMVASRHRYSSKLGRERYCSVSVIKADHTRAWRSSLVRKYDLTLTLSLIRLL